MSIQTNSRSNHGHHVTPRTEPSVIHYLDALPGVGKTTYCINEIVRDRESVHLYVSPTHVLAEQTAKVLKAKFESLGLDPRCVVHVKPHPNTTVYRPVETLYALLTGSLPNSGAADTRLKVKAVPDGGVIVVTHEAFVRLREVPRANNVRVYFDEARKFFLRKESVRLRAVNAREDLCKLIVDYSTPVYSELEMASMNPVDPKFIKFVLPSHLNPLEISGKVIQARVDNKQREALTSLLADSQNPRIDIFLHNDSVQRLNPGYKKRSQVLEEVEAEATDNGEAPYAGVSVYQTMIPSRVFCGFKSCLLMSAYFRKSQMYFMLKRESESVNPPLVLRNLLHTDKTVAKRFEKAARRIQDRYKFVRLIPLTNFRYPISISLLRKDMLVPEANIEASKSLIRELASSYSLSVSKVNALLHHPILGPRAVVDADVQSVLTGLSKLKCLPPIEWYVKASRKVCRFLEKTGEVVGPVVYRCNSAFRTYADSEFGVDDDSGSERFVSLPGQSHGLNTYRESNTVVYLSAINPDPVISQLFNLLIPEYNPTDDHAGDSCVQAVTRLSIRDPEATDTVYIILPDLGLVNVLIEKFFLSGPTGTDDASEFIDHRFSQSLRLCSIRQGQAASRRSAGGQSGNREGKAEGGRSGNREGKAHGGRIGNREGKAEGGRNGDRARKAEGGRNGDRAKKRAGGIRGGLVTAERYTVTDPELLAIRKELSTLFVRKSQAKSSGNASVLARVEALISDAQARRAHRQSVLEDHGA